MSYFKAKMHQIRFRLGLCPSPPAEIEFGAYSATPDPYLDLRGLLLREGQGGDGRGEKRAREGGQKGEGKGKR